MRDVFLGYSSPQEKRMNRFRELRLLKQGLSLLRESKWHNLNTSFIRMIEDDEYMSVSLMGRIFNGGLPIFDIHMTGYFNVITYAGDAAKVEHGFFEYYKQIGYGRHGMKRTICEDTWPVKVERIYYSECIGMKDSTDIIKQWLNRRFDIITIIEHDPAEIEKVHEELRKYIKKINQMPKH